MKKLKKDLLQKIAQIAKLEEQRKALSLQIYNLGGILFSESGFKFNLHDEYPEAPKSPNLLELRDVFRNAEARKHIAELMLPILKKLNPDVLIDLPESTTPLIATLSDLTGKNIISIRSEALKGGEKDHGSKKTISGRYEKSQTGLIIDDTLSSFAYTKFRAISILKKSEIELLPFVYVVVDREEGGRERLQKEGFKLKSLFRLHSDIIRHCFEAKLISEKIVQLSRKFADTAKKYSLSA